ncbi:hypothetical protein [Motilibacter deserti]|uniref:Uncharacterized protein n=1 Tax=Motilibacter deserti TaxID=2714956 RepID=A0ABX0GZT4_9ACTN|nr:hypothetical protein [Motilibacter deserti]NHC16498.1 hypothetical protein [Motilibacter deserti]
MAVSIWGDAAKSDRAVDGAPQPVLSVLRRHGTADVVHLFPVLGDLSHAQE